MSGKLLAGTCVRSLAILVGSLIALLCPLPGVAVWPAQAGEEVAPQQSAEAAVPIEHDGQICQRCRYRSDREWKFCASCGKKLDVNEGGSNQAGLSEMLRAASRAVFRVRSAVRVPGRRKSDDQVRMSLGSGVLIDDEGTVVTSTRSLMQESSKVELISADGQSQVALVVARDPATELAVLRIQTGDLHPLRPCEDDVSLEIGDRAWYIGYPIATNPDDGTTSILPQSIKQTMVSGLRVGGLARLQIEDLIIFDAELNTATGGGALMSSQGCLLGIGVEPRQTTVSVATAWDDTGRTTVAALKKGAAPIRFYLGLGLVSVTDFERRKYRLTRREGVLIDFVIPGSPAAGVDIQKGDLLLQIARQTVDDPTTLHRDIPLTEDIRVDLVLDRGGEVKQVSVAPARRPEHLRLDILDEVEQWFGLGFHAVMYGGISKTGLHVTAIRPGGLGEKYLQPGDILQKVSQSWVNDEKSFRQMAGRNPRAVSMRIRRPSKGLFTLTYGRGYRTYRQPMVY